MFLLTLTLMFQFNFKAGSILTSKTQHCLLFIY